MKITLCLLVFLFISISNSNSQSIEINSLANRNRFYCLSSSTDNDYSSKYNYAVGLCFNDIKIFSQTFKFTLKYDYYRGTINVYDGMMGGGDGVYLDLKKNTLSLGIYPFNYKFNNLNLNFGGDFNYSFHENITGEATSFHGLNSKSYPINNRYTKLNFGLAGNLSYSILLKNNLYLNPQFSAFIGLTNEFKNIPNHTKSFRQYLGIGLIKKLEQKLN
ncbi:MAG: hypothetical protein WCK02_17375 [Bacteroidota bacterium]